jgi:hypothetical protein
MSHPPQGVTLKAASLLAWHPTRQCLLTASTAAVVEYDAVSGARRNLVEGTGTPLHVTYTPNGSGVVLLTKVGGGHAKGGGGGGTALRGWPGTGLVLPG